MADSAPVGYRARHRTLMRCIVGARNGNPSRTQPRQLALAEKASNEMGRLDCARYVCINASMVNVCTLWLRRSKGVIRKDTRSGPRGQSDGQGLLVIERANERTSERARGGVRSVRKQWEGHGRVYKHTSRRGKAKQGEARQSQVREKGKFNKTKKATL